MTGDDWQERRRDVAAGRAAHADRVRAAQTARARELIAGFVAEARKRGIATVPLLARVGDGERTYRTDLTGWYVQRNGSIGITEDGGYYILVSPRSLRAQLTGVKLAPADPPLQVGAGGRDGESIALTELLAMRLEAGDDWPIVR